MAGESSNGECSVKVNRFSSAEDYAVALSQHLNLSVEQVTLLSLRHFCRLEGLIEDPEVEVRLTELGRVTAATLSQEPS